MMRNLLLFLFTMICTGCTGSKYSTAEKLLPLQMTKVPGGSFMMGDIFEGNNDDSMPVHEVVLNDFHITTYEITYKQYDAFAQAAGLPLPFDDGRGRGNRAVVYVNWENARAFCNAYGYRLPAEQEWEYAARSGGRQIKYSGTTSKDSLNIYARYKDNSGPFSFDTGTKEPNQLGIYDMSGNVSEWIGEWYSFYKPETDSVEYYPLDERNMRVIRGGSFRDPEMLLRSYYRVGVLKGTESYSIGFRCVKISGNRNFKENSSE